MASTKTKTGLPESKLSPATPRVAKLSRGVAKSEPNSPSPNQNSRLSSDRSQHSANSKPSIERRSPKIASPSEKTQPRIVKGSESQNRVSQIQEDLKKANEQIASLEKDKAKALDELKEAQKDAEEATTRLNEALAAQKKAEEDSEIEKFQAVEEGITAAHKKEEELKKEFEKMKNQHASVTHELEKVKQELAASNDAKGKALSQADDARKMAEIHAEKVEILSSELTRLKALLDSTREKETISSNEMASKLRAEIVILKGELEKARNFEGEAKERETTIQQLSVDLEAAKMAESYAHISAEEWKSKVKELEKQVEEANDLERSASASLESVTKQLEGGNDRLHKAESEISYLKEKVGTLEITLKRQKGDLEESERQLGTAKEEISKLEKEAEELRNELETVKEEKNQALNSEQVAAASVRRLFDDKSKLALELESSKEEEEKSKKAMESLASALHEVSSEARELKEKLLSQGDHEYEKQIEDLKLVIKATNEKYENMLNEARHEIDVLVSAVEQTNNHFESSKVDWEIKEANWVNHVKNLEEEVASMGREMNRLSNLLKRTEDDANAAKMKESQMKDSLKEVEDEVIYLQETLREARAETMKLKEHLLDKETEFQSVVHENEELKTKENAFQKKIEELSESLEEALAKRQAEENGELSESEKDYDLLPKVVEFSEENGHRSGEEKSKLETDDETLQEELSSNWLKGEHMNGKHEETNKEKEKKEGTPDDDSVEVEFKMWESCQIEKKEAFPERKSGQESPEEEGGSPKIDESDKYSTENINETGNALTAEDQQMILMKKKKKKKTLLDKVGNLLKKKGHTTAASTNTTTTTQK